MHALRSMSTWLSALCLLLLCACDPPRADGDAGVDADVALDADLRDGDAPRDSGDDGDNDCDDGSDEVGCGTCSA